MILTVLRSIGQEFCIMSLKWDLSDVFLMNRLEFGVLGKETTEVKCHSHHIISRVYSIHMVYLCCVNLDHLPEVVFVRFLCFFFFFWPHRAACRTLVPWPGIGLGPSAFTACGVLSTGPPGNSQVSLSWSYSFLSISTLSSLEGSHYVLPTLKRWGITLHLWHTLIVLFVFGCFKVLRD